MKLTDLALRSLSPPEKGQREYPDDTIPGLSVRVSQGGTKTFSLIIRGSNRERVTIGRYPIISLGEARLAAKRILAERTLGKHRPKRVSFEDAITLFVVEKTAKNRPRTIKENERILRKYWKPLHGSQLADVTPEQIEKVIGKLKGTPSTALHAFWTLRTFLRWCLRRRYIDRNPIDALEAPSSAQFRSRVLSDEELTAIMATATELGTYGQLVLMCLYTGVRVNEAANMEASWFANGICTLPEWVCKNRKEHRFPYGNHVTLLLAKLPAEGLLFPSERNTPFSGFSKPKKRLDALSGVSDWVLHDLRRTFASSLQRHVRTEVIEALLNHVSGSKSGITGVYQRYHWFPEMREAVSLWDAHLDRLTTP